MRVLVPLSNGSEEMEAVIVIDMLRRAGLDVTVAGDGDVVICSRGVRIVPDLLLEELNEDDRFDAVVLPGGAQGVDAFIENTTLARIVQEHQSRKAVIGAICAAPRALHEWGLLQKSTVLTSHPSTQPQLDMYAYTLDRVAEDGQLVTSRGAGTAFEFSLALIRRLTNDATALRIAGDIVLYE